MAKVSIIVPVYNAERCLVRAVEAILAQTESDWELILIDDGSGDNSPAICDRYAEADKRILVRHIPNGGVANARNVGLDAASGTYIAFCDSDDWYEPDYLRTLLQAAGPADLTVCNLLVDTEQGGSAPHTPPFTGTVTTDRFSVLIESWFDIYWMGLWNKLFSRDMIETHHLRFLPGLSMGEDSAFILTYLQYAERIACLDVPLYHYVQQNENSLTHRFNRDTVRGFDIDAELLRRLAKAHGCNLEQVERLCLAERSAAFGGYVYLAMADGRVGKAEKKAVCSELRRCRAERALLRKNGGLTQKIIATANYPLLRVYFRLLKLRG